MARPTTRSSPEGAATAPSGAPSAALCVGLLLLALTAGVPAADAQALAVPRISIEAGETASPGEVSAALQVVALITLLSLAPAILLMLTSFTRVIIVLSLLRQAIGVQQLPPNQVLVGVALFLTLFVMAPVGQQIHRDALEPYLAGRVPQSEAFQRALAPLRAFMTRQTRESDLALMVHLAGLPAPEGPDEVPTHVLIPAFALSELKTAFQMGFVLFVPFLIIDMVVASVLMSMGMLMLPPVMISLPFKLLLFVLADGWHLVVRSLVAGFR